MREVSKVRRHGLPGRDAGRVRRRGGHRPLPPVVRKTQRLEERPPLGRLRQRLRQLLHQDLGQHRHARPRPGPEADVGPVHGDQGLQGRRTGPPPPRPHPAWRRRAVRILRQRGVHGLLCRALPGEEALRRRHPRLRPPPHRGPQRQLRGARLPPLLGPARERIRQPPLQLVVRVRRGPSSTSASSTGGTARRRNTKAPTSSASASTPTSSIRAASPCASRSAPSSPTTSTSVPARL